jgi:hypothetical protein
LPWRTSSARSFAPWRAGRKGKRILLSWVDATVCPSNLITVFAFDDDYADGILSSFADQTWLAARWSSLRRDLLDGGRAVLDEVLIDPPARHASGGGKPRGVHHAPGRHGWTPAARRRGQSRGRYVSRGGAGGS